MAAGLLALALAGLGWVQPAKAEAVWTMEILAADVTPTQVHLLLRQTAEGGIDPLPEGDCDSSLADIGETSTECYKLEMVENGAPIERYSYRILETRGMTSFLLVTYPSTVAGDRRFSLGLEYNGFNNPDPNAVFVLSDFDNGTLDPKDPFDFLRRLYRRQLNTLAGVMAANAETGDDAFAAAQKAWAQFVESDCVLAARLAGEAARSRCLADRTLERIDQLGDKFEPD
jgi:hypothetical protein